MIVVPCLFSRSPFFLMRRRHTRGSGHITYRLIYKDCIWNARRVHSFSFIYFLPPRLCWTFFPTEIFFCNVLCHICLSTFIFLKKKGTKVRCFCLGGCVTQASALVHIKAEIHLFSLKKSDFIGMSGQRGKGGELGKRKPNCKHRAPIGRGLWGRTKKQKIPHSE